MPFQPHFQNGGPQHPRHTNGGTASSATNLPLLPQGPGSDSSDSLSASNRQFFVHSINSQHLPTFGVSSDQSVTSPPLHLNASALSGGAANWLQLQPSPSGSHQSTGPYTDNRWGSIPTQQPSGKDGGANVHNGNPFHTLGVSSSPLAQQFIHLSSPSAFANASNNGSASSGQHHPLVHSLSSPNQFLSTSQNLSAPKPTNGSSSIPPVVANPISSRFVGDLQSSHYDSPHLFSDAGNPKPQQSLVAGYHQTAAPMFPNFANIGGGTPFGFYPVAAPSSSTQHQQQFSNYSPNTIFNTPNANTTSSNVVGWQDSSANTAAVAASSVAKSKRKIPQAQVCFPFDLPLWIRERLSNPSFVGSTLSDSEVAHILNAPDAVFLSEVIPPSVYPLSLEAVNALTPIGSQAPPEITLLGEALTSDHEDEPHAKETSPGSKREKEMNATTRRNAKRYAGGFMEMPLLSPLLSRNVQQLIPVRTIQFYAPDLMRFFQMPIHHLSCTQGLLRHLVDVMTKGAAASRSRLTMCSHMYQHYLQPWFDHIDGSSEIGVTKPSFRRSLESATKELESRKRDLLPEEYTAGFPPAPTFWYKHGTPQPKAVYDYGRALAAVYNSSNADLWCSRGSQCPDLHPHFIPLGAIQSTLQHPTTDVASPRVAPHPSLTWSTVHTNEHAPNVHVRFNPGFDFPLAAPNEQNTSKPIPSEMLFVTLGALEFLDQLLQANHTHSGPNHDAVEEGNPPTLTEIVNNIIPENVRVKLLLPPKAAHPANVDNPATTNAAAGGKGQISPAKTVLQHCAHYSKKGLCALGAECLFAHVVRYESSPQQSPILSKSFDRDPDQPLSSERREDKQLASQQHSSHNSTPLHHHQRPMFSPLEPPINHMQPHQLQHAFNGMFANPAYFNPMMFTAPPMIGALSSGHNYMPQQQQNQNLAATDGGGYNIFNNVGPQQPSHHQYPQFAMSQGLGLGNQPSQHQQFLFWPALPREQN